MPVSDYRICLQKTYAKADYIAVNISSPNTKNLRTLQGDKPLCDCSRPLRPSVKRSWKRRVWPTSPSP